MDLRASFMICLAACAPAAPEVREPRPPSQSGGSLVLSMNPQNVPLMVGAYDFELLGEVSGSECADAHGSQAYWVGLNDLEKMTSDQATRQAIAAAALDAIAGLEEADTMVITRVVANGKGANRVCATVFGRGIKLVKAAAAATTSLQPPSSAPTP